MNPSRRAPPNLPPSGVSGLNLDGQAIPLSDPSPGEEAPPPKPSVPRTSGRSKPTQGDVIDTTKGRRVHSTAPTGVPGVGQDIIELPMPKMRQAQNRHREFTSVDGQTYSFRFKDAKGKPYPHVGEMALYLALIEQAKGGSIFTVFNAFKLNIPDANGLSVYPIPENILEQLSRNRKSVPSEVEETQEEEDEAPDGGFSLGGD